MPEDLQPNSLPLITVAQDIFSAPFPFSLSPGATRKNGRMKAQTPYKKPPSPGREAGQGPVVPHVLQEKAAQMMCVWQEKAAKLVTQTATSIGQSQSRLQEGHGLGQVGRPSDAGKGKDPRGMAELTNAIQKFFLEHSRLGIPVIFHEECLHGHAAPGGTSFPQPIGLAATFNPGWSNRYLPWPPRRRGARYPPVFTPVVDVARDPRWAGSRKPTARIPTWCRNSAWLRWRVSGRRHV